MKVEYTLDLEDLVYFNLRHVKALPKVVKMRKRNRRLIPIVYLCVGIGWLIVLPEHWLFSAFIIALAGVWYRLYDKVWEQRKAKLLRKLFKKNEDGRIGAKFELVFDKEGVIAKNDEREARIEWSAIKDVVQEEDYMFIYTGDEDAIIIPRERLENEVVWDELCAKVSLEQEKD